LFYGSAVKIVVGIWERLFIAVEVDVIDDIIVLSVIGGPDW